MYNISAKTGSINKDVKVTLCSFSVSDATLWIGGQKNYLENFFVAVKSNLV